MDASLSGRGELVVLVVLFPWGIMENIGSTKDLDKPTIL